MIRFYTDFQRMIIIVLEEENEKKNRFWQCSRLDVLREPEHQIEGYCCYQGHRRGDRPH